jgi:hypothetical protein
VIPKGEAVFSCLENKGDVAFNLEGVEPRYDVEPLNELDDGTSMLDPPMPFFSRSSVDDRYLEVMVAVEGPVDDAELPGDWYVDGFS